MKALGYSLPFIILLCGVLGLVGLTSLKKDPPSSPRATQETLVETVAAKKCDSGFSIEADGVVVPFREISLASRVSGQVLHKAAHARAGEFVRKGALLFEIDPADYELETRRLKETVKQAGSSIEESDVEKTNILESVKIAEQQLVISRSDVSRFEQLKSKNATSSARLDTARADELRSQNALQLLKNQVALVNAKRNRLLQEQARANVMLDQAVLNLSRTTITSPCDGIIMQDQAEQDDFVQMGAPLVQIEDTSKVEVRFSLRMDQLRWLWNANSSGTMNTQDSYQLPHLDVRVQVNIDGNRFYWPAKIDRYDGAGINAATRTVPIIAVVEDPRAVQSAGKDVDALPLPAPPTLMRNTFVSVKIPVRNEMDLLTIPTVALRPGENVWVFKDGMLKVRKIKVAQSNNETAVLVANPAALASGDRVIVSPLPIVAEGMPLREKEEAEGEAVKTKAAAMTSREPADQGQAL